VTTLAKTKGDLLICCFVGMLGAALLPVATAGEKPSAAQLIDDLMWNRGPIGGPFTLTDHEGKRRSSTEFTSKLLVIYFGYTYCPDICPLDLTAIADAIERLGSDSGKVQPLFITVDPERDTPERLALYVSSIHPRLVGLTGSAEEIGKVALAYKAYFARSAGGSSVDYAVDHTSFIYFADPTGEYLGFLPPATDAERSSQAMKLLLGIPK